MEYVQIPVDRRESKGSASMRRLRAAGRVPGVLFGQGRPNLELEVSEKELRRFLDSGSHLVELKMGDKVRHAILRELQVHPLTDRILHFDLGRVADDVAIEDDCRIVTKGRAKGTVEGGVFQSVLDRVRVRALPRDLPGQIVVDVTGLAVGDAIHARDLVLGDGVVLVTPPDETVCHCVVPRAPKADEAADAAAEEAAAAPAAPSA